MALTSSDRGQTLHLICSDNSEECDDGISFVVFDQLKNTRKVSKPKVVKCISSDIDSLNVSSYVSAYMKRTKPLRDALVANGRKTPIKLFLSWATKREVTKQTIARWLTTSLSMSGIDTKQFKAHSFRGAGLSAAYNKGASIDKIVAHGCWKNVDTFHSYYSAPNEDSNIGQIILSHYEGEHLTIFIAQIFQP